TQTVCADPSIDFDISNHPTIDRYKLLQQIGEGGMGTVFMAQQTEPVKRIVALKLIKPGMDSREVIARFEAERQALAMMDHPNIAHVLDAGTTAEGRPYFVMELVRGQSITDYCDQAALSIDDRLRLFMDVCRAVQHAHQKGVIHRDLKPNNVLVTLHDGEPVVKVIDFGVAKALNTELTERTLFTHFSQMIGTPLYMSPEQAELSGLNIDTRSDVYSLGVLLYELLTGTTPFNKATLSKAGFDGMRRIIREQEPPRPSHRISTLEAQLLSTVSQHRQADPRRLSLSLRRELDWIVMRALEKDRNRRYESASAFAADIKRFLTDESVQACPPSMIYRVVKFSKRNKRTVFAGMLVLLAFIGGIIGVAFGLVRAEIARDHEAEQRGIAQQNATRATDNLRVAIAAVDEMYTEVSENWLRTSPRMQRSRRSILEKALGFYQQFAKNNADPSLQLEMALAWRRVGQIEHGFEEHSQSVQSLRESMSILEKLATASSQSDRIRHELALTYWYCSKPLEVTEQFTQAEKYARLAVKLERELTTRHPDNREYREVEARAIHQLGHILAHLGRHEEALHTQLMSKAIYAELRAAFPAHTTYSTLLGHAYDHVAIQLYESGDNEHAEKEYRVAISTLADAAAHAENNADVIDSPGILLGAAHLHFAEYLSMQNRNDEAEANYREAIRFISELTNNFSDVGYYQGLLARGEISLGNLLFTANRVEEAKQSFTTASRILAALLQVSDESPNYKRLAEETQRRLSEIDSKQASAP
ncbi:MAG: protein kinase, partial [Aureliella sp.]